MAIPNATISGAATLSWIDPKTGLPEVDEGNPPDLITRVQIMNEAKKGQLCRFSNLLEGLVLRHPTSGKIVQATFTENSGMYRGPSFLRLDSAPVGKIGRTVTFNGDQATFRQLVGCRTESPEKIGKAAGGGGGVIAGGIGGFFFGGPIGAFVGAVGAGFVGYKTGEEIAEFASAFPPIWSEVELKIFADGTSKGSVLSHSLFPSNTFYFNEPEKALSATGSSPAYREVRELMLGPSYIKQAYHDGDMARLAQWQEHGWGMSGLRTGPTRGNPWGMADPGPTVDIRTPRLPKPVPDGYH